MQRKLFLVDMDGTLIDSLRLRENIAKRFEDHFGAGTSSKLWEVYLKDLDKNGFVDLKKIAGEVAKKFNGANPSVIENIFLESPFKNFLFPGAIESLEKFKKEGVVFIYSQGGEAYQSVKIRKSGVEKVVGAENVIISHNKSQYLSEFKKRIQSSDYQEIVIIDNSAPFLEEAKKVFPEAKLVLVTEGKYNI